MNEFINLLYNNHIYKINKTSDNSGGLNEKEKSLGILNKLVGATLNKNTFNIKNILRN